MSVSSNKPKFDAVKVLGQIVSYAKHVRLMILMMAFGLLTGIAAYMFTTPTYQSTALVAVKGYGAPLVDREVEETTQTSSFNRAFLQRFRSSRIQLEAAKRMGLLGDQATSEELLHVVPSMLVVPVDSRHIELTVLAYDPEVVRQFAKEMVATYQDVQQKSYIEYREQAITRYTEHVRRLEIEIAETISNITTVEKEQNLTEVMLEQQSLLEIPKQMAQTRERLARMKDMRVLLLELESDAQAAGNLDDAADGQVDVSKLMPLFSLLDSFEEQTEVKVGDVLASSGPWKTSIRANGKETMSHVVAPSEVDAIEPWRKLETERRILLDQLEHNSEVYLPEHRIIKDLKAELEDVERSLMTEFKILRQKFDLNFASLEKKMEMLTARLPEYHAVSEKVGQSAQAYSTIAAKQQMWDQARERLEKKLAAVKFTEDFDWIELHFKGLISLRDEVPVSPNKIKILLLSLMIGLVGAVGFPSALNLLNTSASSIAELEAATQIKGIGVVPMTDTEMLESVARSPALGATIPNYFLECFRVARSNIILSPNHHGKSQVVLVTSAKPQEGKTTQASNLAWAFQSMGEKTLLLDCDLRRGRVHGLLGVDKAPGMTRLLLGECTVAEALQSAGKDSFDFIPRGPVIAGTTELLCQEVFKDLLDEFRKKYDRIVIDSPPALGLSESSSLQKVVDGTVLVVRAEVTGRKQVMDAISLLRRSGAHFFGFVLNAVDMSKVGNSYNYYDYSALYYDDVEIEAEPAHPAK